MGVLLSRGAILAFQKSVPHHRIDSERRKEVCTGRRLRHFDRSVFAIKEVYVPGASFYVVERDARKRVARRLPLRNVQECIASSWRAVCRA